MASAASPGGSGGAGVAGGLPRVIVEEDGEDEWPAPGGRLDHRRRSISLPWLDAVTVSQSRVSDDIGDRREWSGHLAKVNGWGNYQPTQGQ